MSISNQALIDDLVQRTKDVINDTTALQQLTFYELNWKADANQWSILECIEHLNRYGRFYLPEVRQRLENARSVAADHPFASGWLGDYFAKLMLPREQLNKMKTLPSMNPLGSNLDQSVLTIFQRQQKEWLDLLLEARTADLTRTKTAISISRFIKLRLGDTLRVVIYHNQRHLQQAQGVQAELDGALSQRTGKDAPPPYVMQH